MLKSKIFFKKTRKGSVVKIVREHYLRDDVACSSPSCNFCHHNNCILEESPVCNSTLCNYPHYLILDTNVLLNQIDVIEHSIITNVVILQTVLEELKHRSAPIYKRLRDCIKDPVKRFYVFVNEFHKDTYVEQKAGEKINDRNDRAIRKAAKWYQTHIKANGETNESKTQSQIVLLTNDADNKNKAISEGIATFTVHEYIKSFDGCTDLKDKLSIDDGSQNIQFTREIYPDHKSLAVIQKGIKEGYYCQGSFMASGENYMEANVSVEGKETFIFIQGHSNLNRAVDKDIVAIEILPESEWSCPSSVVLIDEEEKADEEDLNREDNIVGKNKSSNKIPTGRVIGIIKRNWRQYCGILQKSLINGATRHLFKPANRKIPKIRIETRQADVLEGQRITVAIDAWPKHSRYPHGHLVRALGEIGNKDTENEVLLLEHDIPHNEFSEAVLTCLPKLPWVITKKDELERVNLRDVCICSVDPPGCTDIDDALHCRLLPNGNYEVGVHIADVSHFIRPGTAIDEEAAKRGTTVYLIDRRIDMVPDLLSSNLCSLRGNEERFAFSVIWEMTPQADVCMVKFHKSIIRSKAALTYAEAQMRIDDPSLNDDLTMGLRRLLSLSKILKHRRIVDGALTLASPEIRFHIDSETHDPIEVVAKKLLPTMSMVEEFMLLANCATAKRTLDEFPDCAVLRRHPVPPSSNFDSLVSVANSKGFAMDVSNGKALAESLDLAVLPDNPYFNTMLRILCTRCMMQAVYFCSGMCQQSEYLHYGLAAPLYTHFTSPIRRYSDVLVHRLLAVSIGADASYPELTDKHKSQQCTNNLNYRHKMAQYAGRASVGLHTQLFFKSRILDENGYILFVRKNAVQVFIPQFGLEGTVFLQEKDGVSQFQFDDEKNTQSCGSITLSVFDPVKIQVSLDQSDIQHQKLCLKLVVPIIENFSVPPLKVDDGPPSKKSKF